MIVVDTSAIVAIALGELERQQFISIIERAEKALVSTVSTVEARWSSMAGAVNALWFS